MKTSPNCKINLGLHVIRRRPDGYHDLESVFLPVPLCDQLEITPSDRFSFSQDGIPIDGTPDDNLVVKAWRIMQRESNGRVGNVSIRLTKNIPFGAGLGGGSSDAAFAINMLNNLFELNFSNDRLRNIAARLGADCPFFIDNLPAYVTGIGDILHPIQIHPASGLHLLLVKPDDSVSTAEAYRNVTPRNNTTYLPDALQQPVDSWPETVVNDFEASVFPSHPDIAKIKNELYAAGALFASMSGSGSALFAFFQDNPASLAAHMGKSFWTWTGRIGH